jgi:hypothetical protein
MLAMQAKEVTSKVVAMWWPIFAFVSLGLDHVVANMFFIPIGIFVNAPGITVGLYIWKGIIPAALGNVVGGSLFVAIYYWWMYLFMEPEVRVDGAGFEPTTQPISHGYGEFRRRKVINGDSERGLSNDHNNGHHLNQETNAGKVQGG